MVHAGRVDCKTKFRLSRARMHAGAKAPELYPRAMLPGTVGAKLILKSLLALSWSEQVLMTSASC